jgi:hypothetical protein
MKQADGRYRWVIFSSNAFQDRIGEIVSTKALEGDVELTDKTGEHGPLRWWHCGEFEYTDAKDYTSYKAGPGLDIGDCDFRMVQGRVLIESGTFRNEAIGEALIPVVGKLQASIRFSHPRDQPDADGVFTSIKSLERSLLPKGKACNRFTNFFVEKEKDMTSVKEKVQAFVALLKDESLVESILKQAETVEKEAETVGIASKETPPEAPPVDEKAKSDKPGDYLVVEKPGGDKVDILHLQVSKDGTPDHGLMGAAHAALMSPKGFRGQPYAGPDKDKAITKLKATYKAENMDWPEDAPKAKEFSFGDIQMALYDALNDAFPSPDPARGNGFGIQDVFPGWFVYRNWDSGDMWRDTYALDDAGEAALGGAPVQLEMHTIYMPSKEALSPTPAPDMTPVITGMKELKDLLVAQVSVKDDTLVSVKEAQEGQLKRIQELESLLTVTAKEIVSLKGDLPKGVKDLQALRASQAESTVISPVTGREPHADKDLETYVQQKDGKSSSFMEFVTAGQIKSQ